MIKMPHGAAFVKQNKHQPRRFKKGSAFLRDHSLNQLAYDSMWPGSIRASWGMPQNVTDKFIANGCTKFVVSETVSPQIWAGLSLIHPSIVTSVRIVLSLLEAARLQVRWRFARSLLLPAPVPQPNY